MFGKLRKLFGLPWRDRLLLLEAAAALAVAGTALLVLPFRWIAPRLGETMADSPADDSAAPELLRRIGWAVGVAGSHLPWRSRCLAEAMAGKLMLQRRGVRSTLYLGLAKDGETDLEAHAWLRCGDTVLTGGAMSDDYAVIASFAESGGESLQDRPAKASRS